MTLKATPQKISLPHGDFTKNSFDELIEKHGYKIQIDKAHRCPCEGEDGAPQFRCQNCLGTGYFYINPIETKALITSLNSNTEYKPWGVDRIGMVNVTVRDNDTNIQERIAFFDKVTLLSIRSDLPKPSAFHTENLIIRQNDEGGNFIFLTYKPQEILSIFAFDNYNKKLIQVTDYSVNVNNDYVIDLNTIPSREEPNKVVAVRYKADVQYLAIDLPHEIRHTTKIGNGGRIEGQTMPMQAVCKRVHLIETDRPNYDGTGIQDNTYLTGE